MKGHAEVDVLFSQSARKTLREIIEQADGNEVFVGGNVDENGSIVSVKVFARGNLESVPAIIHAALEYDVAIHNHPSGQITPSNHDIAISSDLGNSGVGTYIVDNDVSRVYVVVEAMVEAKRMPLDIPEVLYRFTEHGDLPKLLPKYEYRHEQTVMAERVMEAFNEDKHLLVEAGTGVGKSMAYLVPSIMWLSQNKGRIVISTNTINLQQQVMEKDLPPLVEALAPNLRFVLVKGRGNYVCVKKVKDLLDGKNDSELFETKGEESAFVSDINDWLNTTKDGSLSDLDYKPKSDFWELVRSEADTCTRVKCPHSGECFYYKMKKRINSAEILVVNHHILCAELSLHAQSGGQVRFLPRYEKVIIDEAHNFEESASAYFGQSASRLSIVKNLNKIYRARGIKKVHLSGAAYSLYKFMRKSFASIPADDIEEFNILFEREISSSASVLFENAEEQTKAFLRFCRARMGDNTGRSFKIRVSEKLSSSAVWINEGRIILEKMLFALRDFIRACERFRDKAEDLILLGSLESPEDIFMIYNSYLGRLKETADTLAGVLVYEEDEYIRWIELSQNRMGGIYLQWHLTPLSTSDFLRRYLFNRFETVILTSATLTVNKNFSFFEKRLGLALLSKNSYIKEYLESPYDYKNNARMYIAEDVRDVTEPDFQKDVSAYILKTVPTLGGRTFVLFTSFEMLKAAEEQTERELKRKGISLLSQGGSKQRSAILDEFKSSPNNVLFGVHSFWEGVDVAGENLQMIIIPRLPFSVPTDPVSEARQEYIEKEGGNAFMQYIVPLAVIKFKQGFGRLIRSKTDRGVVLLLDKRALIKTYGRQFIKSLPEITPIQGTIKEICDNIEEFFSST